MRCGDRSGRRSHDGSDLRAEVRPERGLRGHEGVGGIVLRKALDVDSVWDALEKEGLRGGLLK